MTNKKSFPLGDILSITTGRLVSRDHIGGVYNILNFMTDDNLFTHALPRASRECEPSLIAQHPQLSTIQVPNEFANEDAVFTWLSVQEETYGETLLVEPLAAEEHAFIDPLDEIAMIRPDLPVIVVTTDKPLD